MSDQAQETVFATSRLFIREGKSYHRTFLQAGDRITFVADSSSGTTIEFSRGSEPIYFEEGGSLDNKQMLSSGDMNVNTLLSFAMVLASVLGLVVSQEHQTLGESRKIYIFILQNPK